MKAEFEIKICTKDMYCFLMYHIYHRFSGVFSILAGLALLAAGVLMKEGQSANRWVFLIFGAVFLVYEPVSLYWQALKQVKLNPVFKHPLHYCVSNQGITVAQNEAVNEIQWDGIVRVRETRRSYLIYTGSRNAFIWVKSQMGTEERTVRQILSACVNEKRLSLTAHI